MLAFDALRLMEDRPSQINVLPVVDGEGLCRDLGLHWRVDDGAGKVSLIGAGMKSHPGIAARMFQTLAEHGINVRMIATSPIKVSCVIARDKVDEAVLALHDAFQVELELAQSGAAHA